MRGDILVYMITVWGKTAGHMRERPTFVKFLFEDIIWDLSYMAHEANVMFVQRSL